MVFKNLGVDSFMIYITKPQKVMPIPLASQIGLFYSFKHWICREKSDRGWNI